MVNRSDLLDRLLDTAAVRTDVALRLDSPAFERLLRSVVETTVALFDAAAASIALVEPDNRLRFRVAAGAQGQGVVGVTVGAGEGIVGFVQATGQPLAISNVAADPRFDRESAARTGYVPRSLLAVPLEADGVVVGVLEVLDKRTGAFDLHDIAMAGMFARQAATAIEVSRVDRDAVRIVAAAIVSLLERDEAVGTARSGGDGDGIDEVAVALGSAADASASPEFWSLVDRLAALRTAEPDRLALVGDLIETALRHLAPPSVARHTPPNQPGSASRHSWRARADELGE